MKTSEYTTKVLTPDDGFVLTQSDKTLADEKRIFSAKVYLGVNDSADNWGEMPVAEADEIKNRVAAEAKAAMEASNEPLTPRADD